MKLPTKEVRNWYDGEGNIIPLVDVNCRGIEIEGSVYLLSPARGTFFLEDAVVGDSVSISRKRIDGGVVANNIRVGKSMVLEGTFEKKQMEGRVEVRDAEIEHFSATETDFDVIDATGATIKDLFCFESAGNYILSEADRFI